MSSTTNIKEQIELLKKLQVIDTEIYILNREKDALPKKLKEIEEELKTKTTGIKEAEDRLKNLQVKMKEDEVSLQQKEDQINKLQTQLYQLKTNKEYSAMLHEIEGIKADNSIIEEKIIKSMEEIDVARNKIKEEKSLFKKEEESARRERDTINARQNEISSRLSELDAQRNTLTPSVDKGILAKYERVLENRGGLGIVSVENGTCGGCHISLPPQVVSESKIKDAIVICNSCSRILYLDDDVEIN